MSQPQPTTPPGAAFTIDLDRAPQAIRDLEDARDQLIDLKTEAVRLGHVVPPAADPVSRDAAISLGAMANGRPGSLMEALDAGVAHLSALIDNLREELRTYATTEQDNSTRLTTQS